MKNYKSIYILSLSIIIGFTSCDEENDINNVVLPLAPSTSVTATITPSALITTVGSDITFDIAVPQAFANDAQIQVDAKSSAVITTNQVILAKDSTTVQSSITVLDLEDGIGFNPITVEFNASGIRLVTIEEITDENDVVTDSIITPIQNDGISLSAEPSTITVYDNIIASDPGGLFMLIDWTNAPTIDLDANLFLDGASVLDSGTGSRYEDIGISNNAPDSNYDIFITVFDSDSVNNPPTTEDISGRVLFTLPTGEINIVEFSIPTGTVSNQSFNVVRYTKTTVNGDPVYSDFIAI